MKTVTLNAYHPWGTAKSYCVECWYRHNMLRSFEGHHYDTLYKMAKAWALINGFTHHRQGGVKGKL